MKKRLLIRNITNVSGLLYYAWIIPGSILVIAFISINLKFIRALPFKTKALFLFSGAIFICGAIRMEAIGG